MARRPTPAEIARRRGSVTPKPTVTREKKVATQLARRTEKQAAASVAASIAASRLNKAGAAPANVKPTPPKELAQTRAKVIAGAALRGMGPTLRESATEAPSSFVSGVNVLGPNLYRRAGGKSESPVIPKQGSLGWSAVEALGLIPAGRPLRAVPGVFAGAKALTAGKDVAEATAAASKAYKESGPVVRAVKGARAKKAAAPLPSAREGVVVRGAPTKGATVEETLQNAGRTAPTARPGKAPKPLVKDADVEIEKQVAKRAGLKSLDAAHLPTPNLKPTHVNKVAAKAYAEYRAAHPTAKLSFDEAKAITHRMHGLASEGAAGAVWYEKSAAEALKATGGDHEEATRIMRVVAYLSAANGVKANVGTAIRAWQEFKSGAPVSRVGRFPTRQTPQVETILEGGDWAGRKSNNFDRNFLEDVHPELFKREYPDDPGFVTVDRWIKEIVNEGSRDKGVGDPEYTFAENAIRGLTDSYGWGRPKRTQAAMWVAIKAATEGTKVADIAGDDVSKFLGAREYVGRINTEGASEKWAGYQKLRPEHQTAYTNDQAALQRDALQKSGFAVMKGQPGVGVFGEERNPAAGLNVLVGATRIPKNPADAEKVLKVSPDQVLADAEIFDGAGTTKLVTDVERKALDSASAMIAEATDQAAAAWVRLFPINNRGYDAAHTTSGYFDVGRQLTGDEMSAVTEAVARAETALGGAAAEGNLLAIHADNGFLVFDSSEGRWLHEVTNGDAKRGSAFKKALLAEINPILGHEAKGTDWFAHAGGYNEADVYRKIIDESGRAGTLRREGDNLRRAVQDLRSRYEAKGGGLRAKLAEETGSVTFTPPAALTRRPGEMEHLAEGTYKPRTVGYHGSETQFPASQSRLTRPVQRVADVASEKLAGPVDVLRGSESALQRGLGRALTLPSARRRVPIQAGKHLARAGQRARAARAEDLRAIHDVGSSRLPGRTLKGEQAANFWYAQLPKSHRNVEGLQLVRGKLVEEQERLSSGAFEKSVKGAISAKQAEIRDLRSPPTAPAAGAETQMDFAALDERIAKLERVASNKAPIDARQMHEVMKAQKDLALLKEMRDAGGKLPAPTARVKPDAATRQEIFRALGEIKKLRAIQADIPERVRDVGENIAKLDKVIANPVKVDERAIAALEAVSKDTHDIMVAAGKLKPEVAQERKGLVSRWVGLEPSGEEVYVGHRLGKVPGSRPSGMPGGVSTGRTKLPAGIAKQNRLVLAKSGRVRQDVKVAAEDWQAAQAYRFTNQAKDELASMGEPILGRPKKGYVVINPKGHQLPRTWKTDDEAQAIAEGFDPDEVFATDLEEYVRNTMAGTPAEIEEMLRNAEKAGHLADLRQVPKDVVNRYYAQFMPAKITVASPGIKEGASALSKAGDIANDTLYLSLIYSNPGYIPSQVVANTTMAVMHQGAFFAPNYARATQMMTTGPKRLRDLLHVEHGQGATISAAGTSPVRRVSGPVAAIADDSFRMSAVIHELARLNVIGKGKPVLTAKDYKAIEEFVSNPKYRQALNDASDRATQSMVDFNRLGAKEAAIAKPAAFVWRWIRGGSRYPIRFAADHPIRTAAAAAAAYKGKDWIDEHLVDSSKNPPWLAGAIETGKTTVAGKTFPTMLPTQSFSPVSTPLQTVGTFTGNPSARTVGELINPGIQAGLNIAQKRNPWGGKAKSYREAAGANLQRVAPGFNLARDLINPPSPEEAGLYPGDITRTGRLKRQLRVFPIAVDPKEAAAAAARYGKPQKPGVAAYRKVFAERQEFYEGTKFAMPKQLGPDGKLIPKLQDAFSLKAEIMRGRAIAKSKNKEGGEDYSRAAYAEEVKTLARWKIMDPKEAARVIKWSQTASGEDVEKERVKIRYGVFEDAYLEPLRETRKALIDAGAPMGGD